MATAAWHSNPGDFPIAGEQLVIVRFRNGDVSGPHPVRRWRWRPWPDGDSDFDIVAWQRA